MTNRNRRQARRPARRSSRLVWVNENINSVLVDDSLIVIDLLTNAQNFMLFDTTIVSVIVEDLHYSFEMSMTESLVDLRVALIVAPSTMDGDDFQNVFADSIGPPWLGMLGGHERVPNGGTGNINLTPAGPIKFKAKRRFRENNSTLFMIIQNVVGPGGATTDENFSGFVRTLLRIP